MMQTTTIACDLCGQYEFDLIYEEVPSLDGPLVRCQSCDLIYVNQRSQDYIVTAETEDLTANRTKIWKPYGQLIKGSMVSAEQEAKHLHANLQMRLNIIKQYISEGTLLDVGCGPGHFLHVAQSGGFQVKGIEPNEKTAVVAREEYGLAVHGGILREEIIAQEKFDAVSLLHVLEHLNSPTEELEKIYRVLKPEGYLFIEVPNIDTIWFKLLGKRWRQFIPDHYYFFTPKTLRKLLAQHGFKVHEVRKIGKKMSFKFFVSRLWRYSHVLTNALAWLLRQTKLEDRGLHINMGDIIFVVAQKE